MPIGLFLDSNIWNFLFDRNFDLSVELPKEEFTIAITREAEFEFPPSEELKQFVEKTIADSNIKTDAYFGFFQEQYPLDKQRIGGFDCGRFIAPEEAAFITRQAKKGRGGSDRPTGLHKHEADVSLAARSFVSIVVTLDRKNGPIKDAFGEGGKIIFLNEFDQSGLSLKQFILQKIEAMNNPVKVSN
jgi:hypothetical protein